ncbi:MAG: peptidyl-prolyl cis-trans isomerase [Alphaproteobacteria bacterium]|nr:peptidyl-prolyl cis-trans isomerase [Alphaproteobacteria bacterium]
MLRTMRGAAETWIVKLLMVFLVISFSIWGVGDIFRGNPQQRTVACIGGFYLPLSFLFGSSASICMGERISIRELQLDFRRTYDLEQQRRGADYTMEKAKQQGLLDRVIRESVARKLFDHVAKEFNLRYDTKAVLAQLANTPDLRAKDGTFDKDKLKRAMQNMHMNEDEFINYMRETFSRDQSIGIFSLMSYPPPALFNEYLKARGQERLIQILKLSHDKMPVPPAPEASVLEKFHQTHNILFTAPEYRSFTVLRISQDEIAQNTPVSDAEVAEAFTKRQKEFAHGEQRDILQVVVGDAEAAQALAKAAQEKHDLRQAAESAKKDAVVLENQTEETIPPALFTTVFTAETGTISDPIKTDFGYHIVQVLKIKPPYVPVLADVKDKLRAKLQREHAVEAAQEVANKVDDEIGAGKSLDEIADIYHLTTSKFTELNREGDNKKGKKSDLPTGGNMILQNVFGLTEGENSALLDDHRGNFLVVRVDKITPSQVEPIANVQEKVLAAWRKEQQRSAGAAEAGKIMAEWQTKPQAFADLAKRPDMASGEEKSIAPLHGNVAYLPVDLQNRIIEMNVGEIRIGRDDDFQYIVRLTGYRAFDPIKNTEAQSVDRSSFERGWRGDVLDQFEILLRANYPVAINNTILDEIRTADSTRD